MLTKLRAFYLLTKPGIVRGNAIHTLAGTMFASIISVPVGPTLAVLTGTAFVIASACVVNNYLDRSIDAKMKRTRSRPSVTGEVSVVAATVYAVCLLVVGFVILSVWTNAYVVVIGIVAYVTYVLVYAWAKRTTAHSTVIGAIPGALPAMAGYVAVCGSVTVEAWLVFLLVFTWQMPHFYAISLFRASEYRSAGLPVLGAVRPFTTVRRYILAYMVLYASVICLLIATNTVGAASGLLLVAGATYWLWVFHRTDNSDQIQWGKSIFSSSLILALLLLVAAVFNVLAPPYA